MAIPHDSCARVFSVSGSSFFFSCFVSFLSSGLSGSCFLVYLYSPTAFLISMALVSFSFLFSFIFSLTLSLSHPLSFPATSSQPSIIIIIRRHRWPLGFVFLSWLRLFFFIEREIRERYEREKRVDTRASFCLFDTISLLPPVTIGIAITAEIKGGTHTQRRVGSGRMAGGWVLKTMEGVFLLLSFSGFRLALSPPAAAAGLDG